MTAALVVLIVGVPAALLAAGLGRIGVRAIWPVLINLAWPTLGAAVFLAVTNSDNPAERLVSPVLTGIMVGGMLSLFSAPLWLGGLWVGRRARQVRAG